MEDQGAVDELTSARTQSSRKGASPRLPPLPGTVEPEASTATMLRQGSEPHTMPQRVSSTQGIELAPLDQLVPESPTRSLEKKLKRSEAWMPRATTTTSHGSYAINAVWGSEVGGYVACGGANGIVMIRDYPGMKVLHLMYPGTGVNTLAGSTDGRLLVIGMRSGEVNVCDVSSLRLEGGDSFPIQKLLHNGNICAVWIDADKSRLVVVSNGQLTIWGRQMATTDPDVDHPKASSRRTHNAKMPHSTEWEKLTEVARPDINSRFMGQHFISGAVSDYNWGKEVSAGGSVVAVGGRNSVQLLSVETGNTLVELENFRDDNGEVRTCNAVWVSEGAHLMAAAGRTGRIVVWGLPCGEVVHNFTSHNRVWAIWGNKYVLATAGGDCLVTIRSLETGSIVHVLEQNRPIYSIWGPADGSYMTIAGRGRLQTRCLISLKVSSDLKADEIGWTEALWSDGAIVAWGGQSGSVWVGGMLNGHRFARFVQDDGEAHVIMDIWCYPLVNDYGIVIASGKTVTVRSLQTGAILHRISTPGRVLVITGNQSKKQLAVGGKWNTINIYELEAGSGATSVSQELPVARSWPCGSSVSNLWIFEEEDMLAHVEGNDVILRSMSTGDVKRTFRCETVVGCIWGSNDSSVLVTGQGDGKAVLWCVNSGARLIELDCDSPVRAIHGCDGLKLSAAELQSDSIAAVSMTLVTGTVSSKVKVWKVTNSGQTARQRLRKYETRNGISLVQNAIVARKHTVRLSQLERETFDLSAQILHQDDLTLALCHDLKSLKSDMVTANEVNRVWISENGNIVAYTGGESVVSIVRLDTLELSGPTLNMIIKTRQDDLDSFLRRYFHVVGPLLMDGSLVEWLITSGHEEELHVLLKLRPSAALLLMPYDEGCPTKQRRSAFQLAILLRRDKTMSALLKAAAVFAREGEPSLLVRYRSLCRAQYVHEVLPPAMRHVTDCMRLALRSHDMKEVILEFLKQDHTMDIGIPANELPRLLVERFKGSPSASHFMCSNMPQKLVQHNHLIWTREKDQNRGFSASAHVLLLPGLTSYSILRLLADQDADLLYTPPVRCLIDAMKANGVQATFYWQVFCYIIFLFCYVQFAVRVVMDLTIDVDTISWRSITTTHHIVPGLVCGVIAIIFTIYFLWLEWNDIFEGTFEQDVDEEEERMDIERLDAKFEKISQEEDAAGFLKWSSAIFSRAAEKKPAQAPICKHTTSLHMHLSRPSPRNLPSVEKHDAANATTWIPGNPESVFNRKHANTNTIVSTVGSSFSVAKRKTHLFMKKGSNVGSVGAAQQKARSFYHTLKGIMHYFDIDIDYFHSFWNMLALCSFAFVIASFVIFLQASSACGISIQECATISPKDKVSVMWNDPMQWKPECEALKARCQGHILDLRAVTTFAVCLTCFYVCYYVRAVDEYAFCVRMLGQITKDMIPFLGLTCWFLVTMSLAFMCLDCSLHSDSIESFHPNGDKIPEFALTFSILALSVFEPSKDDISDCLQNDNHVTRSLATYLFYFQLFVLPLIALNALIAIMGSTYKKVDFKHNQQQYKEWAGIVADNVRKWTHAQRLEFEHKFYWIHVLKRPALHSAVHRGDSRTSRAHAETDHGAEPILEVAAALIDSVRNKKPAHVRSMDHEGVQIKRAASGTDKSMDSLYKHLQPQSHRIERLEHHVISIAEMLENMP